MIKRGWLMVRIPGLLADLVGLGVCSGLRSWGLWGHQLIVLHVIQLMGIPDPNQQLQLLSSNLAIDKKLLDYADYANWTGLVCRGYIRCVFSFFVFHLLIYSIQYLYLYTVLYSTMTCESTWLSLFGAALSNFQMFWEISGVYKQEFSLASHGQQVPGNIIEE